MIVCSCNVLSDGQIRACMAPGSNCPATPAQVYRCLGRGPRCGRCATTIRAIMDEALAVADAGCRSRCRATCPSSGSGTDFLDGAAEDARHPLANTSSST